MGWTAVGTNDSKERSKAIRERTESLGDSDLQETKTKDATTQRKVNPVPESTRHW